MSEPLRITVYPQRTGGGNSGNGNAMPQLTQPEGWNPFNMFQLAFPQFNLGTNYLWIILAILGLFVTVSLVKKGK